MATTDDSPRLRVLINDLTLYRQRSGIGYYVRQLLRAGKQPAHGVEFVRLSRTVAGTPLRWLSRLYESGRRAGTERDNASSPSLIREMAVRVFRQVKQSGQQGVQWYSNAACRWQSWPLYHEPDHVPLSIAADRTVTTVHDLSVLLFPDWHPPHRVQRYAEGFREGLARTRTIVVPSESTKSDLVRVLAVPEAKIEVIPLAPRPEFTILSTEVRESARSRLGLPEQFLLFVGTLEPRKNVARLLRAFARLPDTTRRRFPLLLAGGGGWRNDDLKAMLAEPPWATDARWLGYLPDSDLVAVMNLCTAMVYPSLYEGFGLPPLEAMACGRPVITSQAGSLGEVVGTAAHVVDPTDETALADAMAAVIADPDYRRDLADRGREHLRRFDWDATAARTAAVYRRAA